MSDGDEKTGAARAEDHEVFFSDGAGEAAAGDVEEVRDVEELVGLAPAGAEAGEKEEEAEAEPASEAGDEEAEYEYIYEDEHGNRIDPPPGEVNPEHYEEEVIGVREGPEPAAAGVEPAPGRDTRRLRGTPTRRIRGRRSSRATTRRVPVDGLKHARLKTALMLSSLALIPLLIIAILVMCKIKGRWPFSKPPPEKPRVVLNDYEKGRDLAKKAFRTLGRARALFYRQGKEKESHGLFVECEQDYNRAGELMQKWREAHPGKGFWFVDEKLTDVNMKLREVREKKFMIEQRRPDLAKGGG